MNWRDRAACRDEDMNLFFPGRGQSPTEAKKICRGCDVKDACLQLALATEEYDSDRYGVFGGMSANERTIRFGVGGTAAARRNRREKCPQGHDYTPENTTFRADGKRRCKACISEECVSGHSMTGDNLIVTKQGWRKCRACERSYQRERNARFRAKKGEAS